MIHATALTRSFGTTPVLRGVDVHVAEGEFVAVMGPSGSGKSTLLYCLSGIDRPDSGRVEMLGRDLATLGPDAQAALRLRHFGFVFQQPRLVATVGLLDNVLLPGFVARRRDRAGLVARAHELMERAGVGHLADHDVTQASGGELQRAAVCRALINEPEVLFCDEPTGALNSANAARVLALITEVAGSGTTVVMVTHDPAVAAAADRVLVLADGRVVDEHRPEGSAADRRSGLRVRLDAAGV